MSDTTSPPTLDHVRPLTFLFADDGLIPNNPALPLVVYRKAITLSGRDPSAIVERVFAANGWGDMWRNGIYPFAHYHGRIHEALGVSRGRARVRFGGKYGEELEVEAGDVVVLPAGTGHQRISASNDFIIVGAYPPVGTYDLCRVTLSHHARAKETIPDVPLPETDPVHGRDGPLLTLWRK